MNVVWNFLSTRDVELGFNEKKMAFRAIIFVRAVY